MMRPFDTSWMAPAIAAAASTTPARPIDADALVLSLVPRPLTPWERALERVAIAGTRPRTVRGLGLAALGAFAATAIGVPWIAFGAIGAGAVHWILATRREAGRLAGQERALGPLARPLAPEVRPAEIASIDLRVAYHGILRRHESIRQQLLEAVRIQACVRELLIRCGAMAQLAGRLARLANPLEAYLRGHDAAGITAELDDAATRARTVGDPVAAGTLRQETVARGRTLGTLLELQAIRDRIQARLGVVTATLDAVAASVVKLTVLDLAEAELAESAAAGEASALADELEALEALIDDGSKALAMDRVGE